MAKKKIKAPKPGLPKKTWDEILKKVPKKKSGRNGN